MNGVTSVLASILAIVAAMKIGFTLVICIAAATYLVVSMLSVRLAFAVGKRVLMFGAG